MNPNTVEVWGRINSEVGKKRNGGHKKLGVREAGGCDQKQVLVQIEKRVQNEGWLLCVKYEMKIRD